MDDKKLMQITLGVPSPWFVKSVELNTSEERIDVYFDFIKGSEFACPICNKPCKIHDMLSRRVGLIVHLLLEYWLRGHYEPPHRTGLEVFPHPALQEYILYVCLDRA